MKSVRLLYRPFHKTLPKSSAFINRIFWGGGYPPPWILKKKLMGLAKGATREREDDENDAI